MFWEERMFNLFLEQYPGSQISKRAYQDIFSGFTLKFGVPRSDTCTYCDKQYIKLCAADTERETDAIVHETQMHQMSAQAGYYLRQDTATAKASPNTYVVFTYIQHVLFCLNLTHSSVTAVKL